MIVAVRTFLFAAAALAVSQAATALPNGQKAKTIWWKGYTWAVRAGKGSPGPNDWDPANVFVDSKGFLHLRISKLATGWTCAELDTVATGFGTYQWEVEGSLDTLDKNIVLGLFGYRGPDGVREIDVEFARWGKTENANGNWTVYPESGKMIGSKTFPFTLRGTYTTSRYTWSKTGIEYWFMGGHQPVGKLENVMETWNYRPSDFSRDIPQSPIPLCMNLWLFDGHAPSDGKPVEIVIHDFVRVDLTKG